MIKIMHPDLPGAEVEVPDSALPFHRAAGWVEAEPVEQQPAGGQDEQPSRAVPGPVGDEIDTDMTPKTRRAIKKDGDN